MSRKQLIHTGLAAMVAAACLAAQPASADSVAEFYKGRNVTIITATGAGSAFGLHGRILARHLKKYIPGKPNVIMQFMPGAGGAKMLNYLYNAAPKDGTYIGFPLKFLAINQALGRKGLKYDARNFNYIGSLGPINSVIAVWKATSPSLTFAGMKTKQVIMGSTGKSSGTYITPTIMNNVLGTKFKVVTGYRGMAPIELAMEKGEVHGRAGSWDAIKSARSHWLKGDKIALIAQTGLERNWDLQKLPRLIDLAKSPEDKAVIKFFANADAIGWLFITSPGVAGERVAALRKALAMTARDSAYLAETKAKRLDIAPKTGAEVKALIDETVSTPPELMARIKKAMGTK